MYILNHIINVYLHVDIRLSFQYSFPSYNINLLYCLLLLMISYLPLLFITFPSIFVISFNVYKN